MTKVSSASPADPGLLLHLETALTLALARLTVLLVPFRIFSKALGKAGESPQETVAPDVLRRVSHVIESQSRHLPWRCKCLEQAIAAKLMLRRRGLTNTLYVAVAREVSLEAHAWLRSGDICVTGEAEFDRYTVVANFADGPTH